LAKNGAAIQDICHLVDAASGLRVSGVYRAGVGVKAGILWQKRWMNVQYSPGPPGDEDWCQDAHKTGKANDIWSCCLKNKVKLGLKGFSILSERAMINDSGRNSKINRFWKTASIRPV
jgi:hypothetical protein